MEIADNIVIFLIGMKIRDNVRHMTSSTTQLEQPLSELSELRKVIETLRTEIAYLKEQVEWFTKQR